MSFDLSKLENLKSVSDGYIAACPACRQQGSDSGRSHLKIFKTGAFNCAKIGQDIDHNRIIRAFILGKGNSVDGDVEYIDPTPRLQVDTVYPEDMLGRLIKDHTYWVNRGIRKEIIEMLEGGVSPVDEKSKLSNRYIIPIRGLTGQINGFSGRILTHSTFAPKYKHLFKSSRVCWPWHISGPYIQKSRKVVLNEGWSEWLALANGGIWNTLSLFGLNLSDVMLGQLIATGVEEVTISTNDDPGETAKLKKGKLRALDLKSKLDNFFDPEKVTIRHPKSDWGEATEEELARFKEEIG